MRTMINNNRAGAEFADTGNARRVWTDTYTVQLYANKTTSPGWFHEWLACERSLTHYTLTLEDSQRLRRVPSSAVDVCGSATSPWAAGSTFGRPTDFGRGALQQRRGTVVGTGCTGRKAREGINLLGS